MNHSRQLRLYVAVDVELTPHEERITLGSTTAGRCDALAEAVEAAFEEGRFTVDSKLSYVPAFAINAFNRRYGTSYPCVSITQPIKPKRNPSRKEIAE